MKIVATKQTPKEYITIGTECKTKIGGFTGMITEIKISQYGVLYNVTYEDSGIKNMYFYEFELEFGDSILKQTIGFRT